MAFTVRVASATDAETIAAFNAALAVESEGKTLDSTVLARGVLRALGSPDTCRYYVAEQDGRVIGQTLVTYELTDWRDGVLWWIQSVYVLPDARRRGVFRSLYEHVTDAARRDPHARGLRLYVDDRNARAMETYRALGMHDAGYRVYEHDWSGSVRSSG